MKSILQVLAVVLAMGIAPSIARAQYSQYPDRDRDSAYSQQALSPDDQREFNKEYGKWQDANATNDRDDIAKDEDHMQEIMARYRIPRDVPYGELASGGRGY